ncbi:MAG: hypothetical protein OSA97_11130 [Nevskia sp.]|nr:hypothetical protein [Nevskia sp.]
MTAEVHITSYFSLPTDLAAAMRQWPEFINGEGYEVTLQDRESGERVECALIQEEGPFVRVLGSLGGTLFVRVLGKVTYELAAHSDNLMIDRVR